MSQLTAKQAIEEVAWLRSNERFEQMREDMRSRWDLTNLKKDAFVPRHMSRGSAIYVNSPRILNTKGMLMRDTLAYETTTALQAKVPSDANPETIKNKGDAIEPFFVMAKSRLDAGLRITRDTRDDQLGSSWAGVIMEFGDAKDTFPFSLRKPKADSLYFIEDSFPCVPSTLAVSSRVMLRDLQKSYSGDKVRKTEFAGTKVYLDKAGRWQRVGEGVSTDGNEWTGGSSLEGRYQDTELLELYCDGWIYIIAMNLTDGGSTAGDGEVLWASPSMTGGVPAVITTGWGNEALPFIYPVMQTTMTRNMLMTIEASILANLKPDAVIEYDPQYWEQMREAGFVAIATQADIDQGGPNLIHVPGSAKWWVHPPIDVLSNLLDQTIAEEQQYLSQITGISEREVVMTGTANGIALAQGNIEIQHNVMLKDTDWMFSQFGHMMAIALTGYDPTTYNPKWTDEEKKRYRLVEKPYTSTYELHAMKGERSSGGELVAGKAYGISGKNLDFAFEIVTTTRNVTQAKKQSDLGFHNELVASGVETPVQRIEAMGFPDTEAQVAELMLDDGRRAGAAANSGLYVVVVDDAIRMSAGANIEAIKQRAAAVAQGGQMPPGGGSPGLLPAMQPPNTDTAVGGSNAAGAGGMG